MKNRFGSLSVIMLIGQVAVSENIEKDFTTTIASRCLGVSRPTARKELNRLVECGLLEKKHAPKFKDNRRFVYTSTEKGMAFLERNKDVYFSGLEAFYSEVMI